MGTISMACTGHSPTQTPQPMQSRGDTAMVNLYTPLPLPALMSASLVCAGAAAASSAVSTKGRMVAWGQTKAHWLHWMHFSASHLGTVTAMPRFS